MCCGCSHTRLEAPGLEGWSEEERKEGNFVKRSDDHHGFIDLQCIMTINFANHRCNSSFCQQRVLFFISSIFPSVSIRLI